MGFTVKVDIDGILWKCETLAEAAGDLDKPLAIFGGYLRKRALERYKQQSFAPLAESTIMARARQGRASLEGKLKGDVRKALKRARLAGSSKQSVGFVARLLESNDARQIRHAADDAAGSKTRGVQNREAVLASFQKLHRRGGDFAARADLKALTIKQQISLTQREARAVMRVVNKPILGNLPRTLKVIVESGNVTLKSATHEKWSDAHNEGATVGHGAHLPERKTILLEESDLNVFESILKAHLLLPIQEGAHGPAF